MAPFTGEGLSNALARDFWRADEDLWSIERSVEWRWAKLFWVYAASVVSQLTFGLLIVGMITSPFKEVPLAIWWIGVGGVSAALLLFALIVATAVYIDICRARRRAMK